MAARASRIGSMLLLLLGCTPPEKIIVLYPTESEAARDVLDVVFLHQVTQPDLFVLRPDELAGVVSDHRRGLLYTGSREGTLLALDADRGTVVWEKALGGAVHSMPVITADERLLLVGTDNGIMHAFGLDDREERWSYATEGTIRQAAVAHDGVVYFTNSHQDVFAVAERDGSWRWQYTREVVSDVNTIHGRAGLTLVAAASPVATDVIYTGFDDGRVVALGAASGEALWIASVAPVEGGPFADCDSTPLVLSDEGELVVSGQQTGVFGLALEDGSQRWTFPVRAASSVVRGPGDLLLFSSSLEGMFAIERGGVKVWHAEADPGVLSDPVVVDRTVFFTHSEVGLLALDAETGKLLGRVDTGSGMSSVPTYDAQSRRFYATSNRGLLVAFRVKDSG